MNDKKYIVFRGQVVEIVRGEDGFWRDDEGTLYGYAEPSASVDTEVRAGVGIFSLSPRNPLSDYARGHDFLYSCPTWQAFHYRSEADHYLKECEKLAPGYQDSIVPELFEFMSRQEGFHFWENDKTND